MMQTTALILAGGEGKRFAPLVTGKPLFPFFSQPLISYTAEALSQAGFSRLVVVTNQSELSEVKKALTGVKADLKLVIQKKPTGMADGVLASTGLLQNQSVFIVNAADQVEPELFSRCFEKMSQGKNFLAAKKQEAYFEGGYLKFSKGKLTGIIEKPGEGKQPSDFMSLVVDYFHSANDFLRLLQSENKQTDDRFERALTRLIGQAEVEVLEYGGYWQALKYPWQVLDMARIFLQHRLQPQNLALSVAPSAKIDGNVYLGKGVKIFDNAVVKGPSYIGDNTVVGTNALVVESLIEGDCVIGCASEVTRSYLGKGTWLHRNYLGDSVLEGDNHFGAGALTANFRLDEAAICSASAGKLIDTGKTKFGAVLAKGVRLGVNSSIMPGVKIGSGSLVGPGVVLYRDLPPRRAVFNNEKSYVQKELGGKPAASPGSRPAKSKRSDYQLSKH